MLKLLKVPSRSLQKGHCALCVLAFVLCAVFPMRSHGEETPLTVAVASNFRFPLEQIIKNSDYWSQQDIRLVTGSSGMLYAQITKGAPFDVFLSADKQRPQQLVINGFAVSSIPYAIGKLALWPVPKQILLNKMATQAKIRQLLADHSGKFAIAHPNLAPFGKAAKYYLEMHVSNATLLNNLVLGNNITQAFQFVDSGNATMGLIAESLLIQAAIQFEQAKYTDYLLLDKNSYLPIEQHMLVLNRASNSEIASAFADFIISPQVQSQLANMGYFAVPEALHE